MAFAPGQRVGDYEILDLLGTGGMGRVYRVRNVISDRVEAMKILLPDYASDAELANRFMAEIRTLATLEHPNIAQLRTAFQFENQLVMVMEFVEGSTLEHLASQARLPEAQVVEYGMQVLSGLGFAHSRNVVHRDIKPSNIMITSHGLAKIMDFGIAKSATDLQLTRPGTTMGSVYYMSPEQVRGGTVDARSDLYSFGVTLYEMFTGRRPFQADTSFTVLNAQLNQQPQPPIELNPALSPALNSIILTAMAKDPESRFQSAEAFRNALKASQEMQQEVAATASLFQPPSQPQPGVAPVMVPGTPVTTRSHRSLWIAVGAIAALCALVAAALVLPHVFSTHADQRAASQPAVESSAQPPPTSASAVAPAPAATPQDSGSGSGASQPSNSEPSASASSSPATSPSALSSPEPASVPQPPADLHPAAKAAGSHAGSAAQRKPYVAGNPASQPAAQPAQTVPSPPPDAPGPSPAEARAARDRMANLDARADAVKSGVQSLRSQQQAQGYDLRGDILAAMTRLDNDLSESRMALSQSDLSTAGEYMDRADKELTTLEKFLGR